jgi:hypothetical protein
VRAVLAGRYLNSYDLKSARIGGQPPKEVSERRRTIDGVVAKCAGGRATAEKNALFAGSDRGAAHWAIIASLIGTCRLNDVNPHAYLTDVLERIGAGQPQSSIDDLLPWSYAVHTGV